MALTWVHPSAAAGPRSTHAFSLLALLHMPHLSRVVLGKRESLKNPFTDCHVQHLSLAPSSREDTVTRTNAALLAAQTQPPGIKAQQKLPRCSLLHLLGIPDSTGWRADR